MDTSNHRIGLQHWASEGIAGESWSAFRKVKLLWHMNCK